VLAGGKLRRSGILLEHKGNPTTKDTVPSYCGFRTNRYIFTRYADDGLTHGGRAEGPPPVTVSASSLALRCRRR
jgi:hypothetical protein